MRFPRFVSLGLAGTIGTIGIAGCGAQPTAQGDAAKAITEYIANDNVLADSGFDEDCIRSTAAGLTDDAAKAVIADEGRIDFDVSRRDRDDVYDFYDCADERDMARAIADEFDLDDECLEDVFAADGIGETFNAAEDDEPGRLGDFDAFETGACAGVVGELPTIPLPPVDTVVVETTPPTTTPPTVPPTVPPTAPPTAPPTVPPSTMVPQSMPDAGSTPEVYAAEAEDFLANDQIVADAVGGDVSDVLCLAPVRTTVGSNYLCFGEAAGFGSIEFVIEIDAVDSFLVSDVLPSIDGPRILVVAYFVTALATAAETDGFGLDQVCLRNVATALSDDEVALIVANLEADEFPAGVDSDRLTTDLANCIEL
jgi:hypothetical protein